MEVRSSRRVRTLVTQMARQGLSANKLVRALISMMARSTTLQSKAGYIDARPLTANSTKTSCDARPDHTLGSNSDIAGAFSALRFTPKSRHHSFEFAGLLRANSGLFSPGSADSFALEEALPKRAELGRALEKPYCMGCGVGAPRSGIAPGAAGGVERVIAGES